MSYFPPLHLSKLCLVRLFLRCDKCLLQLSLPFFGQTVYHAKPCKSRESKLDIQACRCETTTFWSAACSPFTLSHLPNQHMSLNGLQMLPGLLIVRNSLQTAVQKSHPYLNFLQKKKKKKCTDYRHFGYGPGLKKQSQVQFAFLFSEKLITVGPRNLMFTALTWLKFNTILYFHVMSRCFFEIGVIVDGCYF